MFIQVATLAAAYKFIEALHGITLDNISWCVDFSMFQQEEFQELLGRIPEPHESYLQPSEVFPGSAVSTRQHLTQQNEPRAFDSTENAFLHWRQTGSVNPRTNLLHWAKELTSKVKIQVLPLITQMYSAKPGKYGKSSSTTIKKLNLSGKGLNELQRSQDSMEKSLWYL